MLSVTGNCYTFHLDLSCGSGNTGEEADKAACSSRTVDFYDDMFKTQVVNPVSNEFETQLVDPLGETQVFDVARETQISSLGGETQELDDPIPDCVKNMNFDTQILNDSDGEEAGDCYDDEGTETTEINLDLSGDESAQSYDQMTSLRGHDARKDLEVLRDTLPDKKCNSGIILLFVCTRCKYFLWLSIRVEFEQVLI